MSCFWCCTAGWLTYLQTEKGVGSAGAGMDEDDETMGATPPESDADQDDE